MEKTYFILAKDQTNQLQPMIKTINENIYSFARKNNLWLISFDPIIKLNDVSKYHNVEDYYYYCKCTESIINANADFQMIYRNVERPTYRYVLMKKNGKQSSYAANKLAERCNDYLLFGN